MKVSIITISYNSEETIEDTIKSVVDQDYHDLEYIIVDGLSGDGTMDIIDRYKSKVALVISERDKGIYDAMNKGVRAATGDIVGILNSDDLYANNQVISEMVKTIGDADAAYADLVYVTRNNTDHITRSWKAGAYKRGLFKKGWMFIICIK